MALQEKKLTEAVRTVNAGKSKAAWETIPMGRVLHWFSQAPVRPESTLNRNTIARDQRSSARLMQHGRRKVI